MTSIHFEQKQSSDVRCGNITQKVVREHVPAGETLNLYAGLRQPYCALIAVARSLVCVPVEIDNASVKLCGSLVQYNDLVKFTQALGFETLTEFFDFHERVFGLPFSGYVLSWELRHGS